MIFNAMDSRPIPSVLKTIAPDAKLDIITIYTITDEKLNP